MVRAKLHVKKEDTVLVISGKDKGKKGKILHAFPKESMVLVEGINIIKRHMRPTQENPKGGIMEREAPIYASKVMLLCPRCNQPTRIGKALLPEGRKVRICKRCGEIIDKV